MNKNEFVTYISEQNNCTKVDAAKAVDMFVAGVTDTLGSGKEILLMGFGSFSVKKVPARKGRNPGTGETIQIKAYNQPKFKSGKKLKDTVNNK